MLKRRNMNKGYGRRSIITNMNIIDDIQKTIDTVFTYIATNIHNITQTDAYKLNIAIQTCDTLLRMYDHKYKRNEYISDVAKFVMRICDRRDATIFMFTCDLYFVEEVPDNCKNLLIINQIQPCSNKMLHRRV